MLLPRRFFLLLLLAKAMVLCQDLPPLVSGARYDSTTPTPRSVLGYELGEEISLHAEIEQYILALAASSDRIRLVEYGKSWEGRRLYYLVLGTKERLANLDVLKAGMQKLADPRTLQNGAGEELCRDLPAVAWLAYTVHGDEPSGSDAALHVAYHLLAAQDDPLVSLIRKNCIVIIDPLQNPDGRDRFVHGTRAAHGLLSMSDPQSAEHTQPWPGGRPNHYLFDMNRDWFAMSQPETQARVRAFQQWWPQVYVDLHEMGGNSTYYFSPPSPPLNPEITGAQREWLTRYGKNNAQWFDRYGIDYFTREAYDSFYPGYGEGWPTFQGTIGMTFEQGSSRGLLFRREDETLLSYRECVRNHVIASLGTLETVANNRQLALQSFLDYRRSAIEEGRSGPVTAYVFPDVADRTRLARLMNLLSQQGIEVHRASGELRSDKVTPFLGGAAVARSFAEGSYVVSLAQPQKRLASVLLQRHFDMDADFLKEQQAREKKRLGLDFYDLTGWSLPLLFDVETFTCATPLIGPMQLLLPGAAAPVLSAWPAVKAKVGYVVPWTNGSAALLIELLQKGIVARTLDKPFRLNGSDFAAGSYVVRAAANPVDLHQILGSASKRLGVFLLPTDTSWVESGINFGSNNSHVVRTPSVAMAWDRPVNSNSAGYARFLLERRYGLPVTPIRTADLGRADLDRYTVLVLPEGNGYGQVLGKAGAERIVSWVDRGGVLIALGSAATWLAEENVGLLATKAEDRLKPDAQKDKAKDGKDQGTALKDEPKTGQPAEVAAAKPATEARTDQQKPVEPEPFDYEKAIRPDKEKPPRTPGAIFAVHLDVEHFLAFGCSAIINVVSDSSDIFTPVKLDRGTNVGVYAKEDQLVRSGFVWADSKKQFAQKAWLVHQPKGKGHVVAFAEDPNLRAFADGLNLLFLNAVLLATGR